MPESRSCKHCGAPFVARNSQISAGTGLFCSRRCSYDGGATKHITSTENLKKAAQQRAASVAINRTKHKSGAEHHSWRGGKEALKPAKLVKERAYRQSYRAKNKEKVLEFTRKRRGLMVGRLPRGTVKRIGDAQRWLCVVCKTDLKNGYHMDHIMPLEKGGSHEPKNIQLLCPSCNVRKSAKHPVDFMQERGFLL